MGISMRRGFALLAVPALTVASLAVPSPAIAATGGISGTITDNGAPVANAYVYLESEDRFYERTVRTNSQGGYAFTGVPVDRGPFVVSFEKDGRPRQYAYGETTHETATRINVVAGQTSTVDDEFLPVGTISGRFTDRDGNGVPGVQVRTQDVDRGGISWGSTNHDGYYTVRVFPGTHRVMFQPGGPKQYAYGTADIAQAAVFTVAAGATVTVNDTRFATGAISGQVTHADGTPAANIYVRVSGAGEQSTRTNSSGAYHIGNLLPGSYRVAFELGNGSAPQYAPQQRSRSAATLFTVTADQVTTVNEQLLPIGTIAGRFTTAGGAGLPDVEVRVIDVNGEGQSWDVTDSTGSYQFEQFVGDYRVHFSRWDGIEQWAYGKVDEAAADAVTVTAGATTTVNDTRLPTGSVRITAKDAVTGAPIDDFDVFLRSRWASTTNGVITLADVPVGTHPLGARGLDHPMTEDAGSVTVTASSVTNIELVLQPYARITTTVTDRATGAPVGGVCVLAMQPTRFEFPGRCEHRSAADGTVTVSVATPGAYRLFALPDRSSPYGAQWVGATGGTGSQVFAQSVTAVAGSAVAGPSVLLDPRGTITGTVSTPDGSPINGGTVGVIGPDTGFGTDRRYARIGSDGSYQIDWLGPYRWPLIFQAQGWPYQWSGGIGNRLLARPVLAATTGTTYDYTLRAGATVSVTGAQLAGGRAVAYNAITGDPMGIGDGLAGIDVKVLGPQVVKIACDCGAGLNWYGGAGFADADAVFVPKTGTVTVGYPAS
jgi:hypothetical protein